MRDCVLLQRKNICSPWSLLFLLNSRIRANHIMVPSYLFLNKADCPHPRCQNGPPPRTLKWYPGDPPISHLPLPVPDPERPWGSNSCSRCTGFCSSHYKTLLVDVTDSRAGGKATISYQLFSSNKGEVSDEMVEGAAKKSTFATK